MDEATKKVLTRGRRIVEAFKQKQNHPLSLWQEVVVVRAATGGKLDSFPAEEVQGQLGKLFAWMEVEQKDLIKKIEEEKALTDDINDGLKNALDSFFSA